MGRWIAEAPQGVLSAPGLSDEHASLSMMTILEMKEKLHGPAGEQEEEQAYQPSP
jgi:hypothetical protein